MADIPTSNGFRFDPPQIRLADAWHDDLAGYAPPPVHVLQPRALLPKSCPCPKAPRAGPNPYVDYSRRYTGEGGILLSYKTEEGSFWGFVLRVTIWLLVMGLGGWLLLELFADADGCQALRDCAYTPRQWGYGGGGYAAAGLLLALLLMAPTYAIHTIEIRPYCLILDGSDVFWAAHMEARPAIRKDETGSYTLKGIYGTRYMDFLTLRPVDSKDATPAVLASHIENALKQLWDQPQVWAGD